MANKSKPKTPIAKLVRKLGFIIGGLTKRDIIPDGLEDKVIDIVNKTK